MDMLEDNIRLQVGKTSVTIKADGTFFVNDKKVATDIEVFKGFQALVGNLLIFTDDELLGISVRMAGELRQNLGTHITQSVYDKIQPFIKI